MSGPEPPAVGPAPLDPDVVLSPAWLSTALSRPIDAVEVRETRADNIATKVRVATFGPDGDEGAFCVKGYFRPESAAFRHLGALEARFYRDIKPLTRVESPTLVYDGVDPDTGHALIVMDDLVEAGCEFLTVLSPYTPDQAEATLAELAELHHTELGRIPDGLSMLEPRLGMTLDYIDAARLQELLDDGRCDGLPAEVVDAERLRAAFTAIARRGVERPDTLIHADCHAGNLYLTADGSPGLIDYQILQTGPWEIDVAYHVSAVLDPADRQAHERDLVRSYLERRRTMGDDVPDDVEAWDLYREALVYGWYMWAITYRVDPVLSHAFTQRMGRAVAFHDSFGRLGA